ncbi:hypothetical protein [Streptomyces sp. NPDC006307]|uniref:hypothetical protein n=1 Tax=Streptomyces sp. NPDC006307 TaxID=3156748 RepID=UPI0033A0467F
MTAAAAVPVAALRLVRGAARRHAPRRRTFGARALTAALFLGGLLALGFLCGGQAYAAEGTAGTAVSGTEATPVSAERLRATVPQTAAPRATDAVREVAGRTAEAAQSAESVGGAVALATGAVRDLGPNLTGALPAAPVERPSAPGLPELPAAPELPQAPVPAEAESPGAETVAGTAIAATGSGAGTASATPAASHAGTATPAWPYAAHASGERLRTYGEYGEDRRAVARPATPPAAPEPCPGGACLQTAGAVAGDSGSPRGGDQHATGSASLPYPGPVRGAGLPATVAPVHDRPHDILEFPG